MCKLKASKPDRLLGVVVPFVGDIAEKQKVSGDEEDVQRLNGCSMEVRFGDSGKWVWSTSCSQVHLISLSSIMIDPERTAVAVEHVVYS